MADILRRYLPPYQAEGHFIARDDRRILSHLLACRTASLGGHLWECEGCNARAVLYNSCRHRHCTTCGGQGKLAWFDRIQAWAVPRVYYHTVTTLPHKSNDLVLANRRVLYGLLFQASSQALQQLAAEMFGIRLGLVGVLHTWGQRMAPLHPHIHYLCPGGGLLLDGSGWRDVPTTGKKQRLVPLAVLRTRYRELFLAGLKKLYATGKLRLPGQLVALTDPAAFNAFVLRLDAVDWVVHCKGPPLGYGHSVAAMKYLAGYVRGTAICDARIVADDGEYVSFRVKEYRAGGTAAIEKIRGTEFVGRFLMHLLPPRLMRIRYYGMYSGRRRGEDIPRAQALIGVPVTDDQEHDTAGDLDGDADEAPRLNGPTCERCQVEMFHVAEIPAEVGWRRTRNTSRHLPRRSLADVTNPPRPP